MIKEESGQKPKLYVQETMSPDIVPLATGSKEYHSFADWLMDPEADKQKKRKWIWEVKDFETLYAITKKDLQAALRFMAEDCYHVETRPNIKVLEGGKDGGKQV